MLENVAGVSPEGLWVDPESTPELYENRDFTSFYDLFDAIF